MIAEGEKRTRLMRVIVIDRAVTNCALSTIMLHSASTNTIAAPMSIMSGKETTLARTEIRTKDARNAMDIEHAGFRGLPKGDCRRKNGYCVKDQLRHCQRDCRDPPLQRRNRRCHKEKQ
jgi:hypothetical protein